MVEFKDRLELALKMRDMKPADLAKLTGIGEGAISQYRKGAYKATQRNLEKISKVLDVSIPWLMGCDEKNPPAQVDERIWKNICSDSTKLILATWVAGLDHEQKIQVARVLAAILGKEIPPTVL